VVHLRAGVGGDDHLGDAAAVAQVEKNEIAEIAALVHPSHERNFGTGVGGAQFATHMSTFQVTEKIEHGGPYEAGIPSRIVIPTEPAAAGERRNLRLFLSVPQIPRLASLARDDSLIITAQVRRQLCARHLYLLAAGEVLHCELSGGHFVLAHDDNESRTRLFGALE